MSRNIKDYDSILIKFVFGNLLLIFIPDLVGNVGNDYIAYLTGVGLQNGLGLIVTSILTLLVNGLYKSDWKYILVFWKIRNNLPGHRVFTELSKKDERIDYEELVKKYHPLPTDPSSQNRLWYKTLKRYPDDEMILQSHRDFLLFRDLTTITFSLLIIYILLFIILGRIGIKLNILYIIIFAVEYLMLVLITRNKAERFALNVIAHDLGNKGFNINI